MRSSRLCLGALVCGLLVAGPARAGWHLDGEVVTDQPVDVGGKLWLELPGRLHVNSSLGYVPGADIDALNSVLVGFGAYNDQTAGLIRSGLASSMLWRLHAGWTPFARHGFYFEAGYGRFWFGGSATTAELIEAATGRQAPPDPHNAEGYHLDSTLHMVDAELGWRWRIAGRVGLRAAVGFAGTVSAATSVRPNFTPQDPQKMAEYTRIAEQAFDAVYETYVFTPTVSLAAGWRFF